MIPIEKIKKRVQRFGLLFLAILLLSFPYLTKTSLFENFEVEQLLGLVVGILTWIYLDLDKKLNQILIGIGSESQLNLSKALTESISKKKKIKHLRVLASTSGTILSNIRGLLNEEIHIERCTVIVKHNLGKKLSKEEIELNNYINDNVDKWYFLKDRGVIDEVKIVKYDFEPLNYYVIIDDIVAIQGLFNKTTKTRTGVFSDHNPFVIRKNVYNTSKINSLVSWFDSLVEFIEKEKVSST